MKIEVKDLHPNPFRHLERYPVSREKVDALKRSIRDTEFWDNVLVRRAPDGNGYQMGYGHHRYVALKELRIESIDVPCRKLDDTTMAKIMAHENMEEWAWSALVEQETVRSIVEGFADGKIELPAIKSTNADTRRRYAPSFLPTVSGSGRPEAEYSAATLAKFLGWNESKIEAVLNALSAVEKGLISEAEFEGLTTYQAEAVARQVRRVEKETDNTTLARTIGKRLATGMRSSTGKRPGSGGNTKTPQQEITLSTVRAATDQMMGAHRRAETPKAMPPVNRFAEELAMKLADVFPTAQMQNKIDDLTKYRADIGSKERRMLVGALRALAKRADRLADKLEG